MWEVNMQQPRSLTNKAKQLTQHLFHSKHNVYDNVKLMMIGEEDKANATGSECIGDSRN